MAVKPVTDGRTKKPNTITINEMAAMAKSTIDRYVFNAFTS